ncbi:MAG: Ig-like domain-containing protein, partial [Novosphingobium sp.]
MASQSAAPSDAGGGIIQLVPDANNVVVLPDGATLDNLVVRGRDLVIETADGHLYVIHDGAVFVPQIVAQGVTVPPLNLAALLIGHEPQPAAGPVRSSGGNFEVQVNPLQNAYDLGNLLPYTELAFPQPQTREITPLRINRPVTLSLIHVEAPDSLASVTINGIAITAVGQTIVTPRGTLTITSIAGGDIGYSYTLADNTSGDNTSDPFTVVATDTDGDTATGTITIGIIDDVPTARNDTDAVAAGTYGPESGNVMTGTGTTSGAAGADTQGADGATVTGFHGAGSSTFVAAGSTVVGTYGTLTFNANGTYTYTRNAGTPGGVSDVFTYQITDGDGDTSTATLTINIADATPRAGENATVLLDDDALAGGNPGGTGDTVNAANTTGTLAASGGDGPLAWALSTSGAPAGFTYVANGTGIDVFQGATKVMAITLNTATGVYSVTQVAPIQHAAGGDENNQAFTISYTATDQDGDAANGTLSISVNDDTPTATN